MASSSDFQWIWKLFNGSDDVSTADALSIASKAMLAPFGYLMQSSTTTSRQVGNSSSLLDGEHVSDVSSKAGKLKKKKDRRMIDAAGQRSRGQDGDGRHVDEGPSGIMSEDEENYKAEPVIMFDETDKRKLHDEVSAITGYSQQSIVSTGKEKQKMLIYDLIPEELEKYEGFPTSRSNRWITLKADVLKGNDDAVCNHCQKQLNESGECIHEYPFAYSDKSIRTFYHQECYVSKMEAQMEREQVHHEFMIICGSFRAAKTHPITRVDAPQSQQRSHTVTAGGSLRSQRTAVGTSHPLVGTEYKQRAYPPPRREVERLRNVSSGLLDRHLKQNPRANEATKIEKMSVRSDEKSVRISSPTRIMRYDDLGNARSESFERSYHNRSPERSRLHYENHDSRFNTSHEDKNDRGQRDNLYDHPQGILENRDEYEPRDDYERQGQYNDTYDDYRNATPRRRSPSEQSKHILRNRDGERYCSSRRDSEEDRSDRSKTRSYRSSQDDGDKKLSRGDSSHRSTRNREQNMNEHDKLHEEVRRSARRSTTVDRINHEARSPPDERRSLRSARAVDFPKDESRSRRPHRSIPQPMPGTKGENIHRTNRSVTAVTNDVGIRPTTRSDDVSIRSTNRSSTKTTATSNRRVISAKDETRTPVTQAKHQGRMSKLFGIRKTKSNRQSRAARE